MFKKLIILCSLLLSLGACQKITTEAAKPAHPVIGKWAQDGKCEIIPWVFNAYTVRWGQNSGTWEEDRGTILIKAHITQDNAIMHLRLSLPQNNRMTILSADYGDTKIGNLRGQLIRCP